MMQYERAGPGLRDGSNSHEGLRASYGHHESQPTPASRRLDETSCLIADIHMPAITGLELYGRLVQAGRRIPTILVTAYPDETRKQRWNRRRKAKHGTA